MTEVTRVRAMWAAAGKTGMSSFHFSGRLAPSDAQVAGNAVNSFFIGIRQYMRTDWSVTVDPTCPVYDILTSQLQGEVAMPTPLSPTTGLLPNTQPFVAGAGAAVRWHTDQITFGHHTYGKTFLVPGIGDFQDDGSLSSATISAILAAATSIINKPPAIFVVWSKKFDRTVKPPVQTGGALVPVTSASVPDQPAFLRSRR